MREAKSMTYITIEKEKVMLALEALNDAWGYGSQRLDDKLTKVIKALEEALASEQGEPVALKVYRGELCYKSQADDQSFGMWCPVTQDLPFPEGTKFYTTPPQGEARGLSQQQRKPLTDEQIANIVIEMNGNEPPALFWKDLTRAIEAAHGITSDTDFKE